MDLTTRVNLVQNLLTTKGIPASVGAKLLDINRTSIYYKGIPVSEEELSCKEIMDHLHTENPTWGARQMSAQLKALGFWIVNSFLDNFFKGVHPVLDWCKIAKRGMNSAIIKPVYIISKL